MYTYPFIGGDLHVREGSLSQKTLGQNTTGQILPGQLPPQNYSRAIPPGQIPARTITTTNYELSEHLHSRGTIAVRTPYLAVHFYTGGERRCFRCTCGTVTTGPWANYPLSTTRWMTGIVGT